MKGIINFILLCLFLTGCVATDTSSTVSPNTPTPFRIETLVPTESMTLYKDDFTQMSGDWWEGETDYGSLAYESDGYHILGLKSEIMNWSILEKMTFGEGVLRLNYQQLAGDEKTTGVVIFWQLIDEENFYFLQILGNGYYSIAKYLDGEVVPIKSMKKSPFLYPEIEENMVTIAFNKVTTDLFFNNQYEASFQDSSFTNGMIGLGVIPDQNSDVEIRFINLEVFRFGSKEANVPTIPEPVQYTSITWSELVNFLAQDHTNWNEYDVATYNCIDFAVDLSANAKKQNIYTWLVGVDFAGKETGHIFVAFQTSDKGVIYVEPQRDYTYSTLQVGTDLCDDWGKDACWGFVEKITYFEECDHDHYCTDLIQ